MPGIDGIETLTELRRLERGNDARIVVVSGTASEQHQWRLSVLGVTDFFEEADRAGRAHRDRRATRALTIIGTCCRDTFRRRCKRGRTHRNS